MQLIKIFLLSAVTIGPVVGLRLAWKWARKRGRQFNERHPRYKRRRPDEPAASAEEFFFAPMPRGWLSSWNLALAVALAGALAVWIHEVAGG